jgi:peroxiredoxin
MLVRREYQLACRGPAFWAVTVLGSLLAVWQASTPGTSAALAAYQTRQMVIVGIGALAILLAGSAASRDRRQRASELVLSKPGGSSSQLVAARFVGIWLSLLSMAAIILTASWLSQGVLAGTPSRPAVYLSALALSVVPIGLAVALGFSFASLLTTPLASGAAAIYWIAVPLSRSHLAMALDLTLSQHWCLAALLSAALVALSAGLHARPIRGEDRRGACLAWGSALLFAGAGTAAFAIISQGHDALLNPNPVLSAIASQTCVRERRAPGFWLPDAQGRLVGLNDLQGRPVLLAFWGPAAPDSARALEVLSELASKHAPEGLASVGVCLDRDAAAVRLFSREMDGHVVMVWDRGRHFGDGLEWSDSPLAIAYEVTGVPTAFLLDRERRVVGRWQGEESLDQLHGAVSRLLAEK